MALIRPYKKAKAGFSLVELMVVLAIINTTVALGIPASKSFKYKAIQAQAQMGLKTVTASAEAYFGENDGTQDFSTLCPSTGTNGSHVYCNLVWGGTGGATDCNLPNPFGYKVTDCRKNYYEAYILQQTVSRHAWRAIFFMKAGAMGSNLRGADSWEINRCHEICQAIRITSLLTMSSEYILPNCPASNGNANNFFYALSCTPNPFAP